ncbi:hypothetical protein [Kitasatospora sp. NPDC001175]|uniref:hypothetical protein n=1 Tax=Kitasatospora sp. NPDC001175 TaxID=3157103 RepID=UPI003D061302
MTDTSPHLVDLRASLFERTTHSVALTPAGTVLLDQARIALDALDAAARRAQRAAGEEPKVVLAVKANADAGRLEAILERYAAGPGAVPVEIRLCGWGEQPGLLRRGEADAALVYEPFDHTGLDTEPVAVDAKRPRPRADMRPHRGLMPHPPNRCHRKPCSSSGVRVPR